METSAHDLAATRMCRLPGCGTELGSDDPKQGRWANMCRPCRQGLTGPGRTFRESVGLAGSAAVQRTPARNPQLATLATAPAVGAIEAKAKAIVPLARALERKLRATKTARATSAAAVTEFSQALVELRDAAKSLLES